ncbi:PAS domain S-box protein [Leptospira interrogans]|nr:MULTISPECIES: PAS domain S-box protein [Leptospira]EMF44158.1 PAS domain S-box protein [Leptospira interrogans serovar Lora str. TE 1992]EMF73888.1 PAS domain S-box protein [Leptospira interrogans serovar Canicola str. LT1962]EMM95515.1 PAS domain S-box protein [Leptospira interrogans serovar Zanoni str. LT2156]EMN71396.1 PAS domain S-box protein [Leptospira interrogans serovar Bataviae str. UI 08561]AAS69807.1 histidine kinase sensor protein [Leptospira interrogans serovar Copenhageni str.
MQLTGIKSLEEFSDSFSSFQDQICILEERPSGKIRLSKECIRFWQFKGFNRKPGTFPSFLFHLHGKIRNYADFTEKILLKHIQDSEYFDTLFTEDHILRFFWKVVFRKRGVSYRLYTFEILAKEGDDEEEGPDVESIFYKLPEPAFLFHPSTLRFLAVNDAALYLYGFSRKEFSEMNLLDIRPEEDRADMEIVIQNFAQDSGIRSRGIWRHWRKDKKFLYVKITTNRISFRGSFAVLVILTDVSETIETSYALKQSRAEKQSIIESMSDRYFALSKDWRFISANQQSLITLGKTQEELIGRNIWDLFSGSTSRFFKNRYEHAVQTKKPLVFDYKVPETGNIMEYRVFPFEEGISVFFQDITEKRRRETEQNILKEVTLKIPNASSVKQSFEILFETICKGTSWSFAQTWRFQKGEIILEENSPWYSSDASFLQYRMACLENKFSPGEGTIGKVFSTKKIRFVKDVQKEKDFKRTSAAVQNGIRSWIAIPLQTGHETYVLEFFTQIEIDLVNSYIQMFELIADQVGVLFKNKESEEEKDHFFKLSGDLFQISTLDGQVIEQNQAWEEILGYTPEELEEFDRTNIVHPEDRDKMLDAVRNVRKYKKNVSFALRYITKQGQTKTILWKTIASPEHGLVYASGKDITEIQDTQLKLENLTRELKRSNADLEDFAFIASHDLQEPLRKIMAFGDRLLKKNSNLDSESMDYLQRMYSSACRLSNLIEGLLSYSRIKSKSKPFQFLDLSSVLKDVIGDLEIYIKERNANVVDSKLGYAWCDPSQMGTVFQNLIKNGIKFNRSERPEVIVQCVAHPSEPNWIQISFSDNGIGFDKKHEDKIFTIFQRLHNREDYEGNGIGLAVCKKIIELHGGRIYAKSTLRKGSTFYLEFPGKLESD